MIDQHTHIVNDMRLLMGLNSDGSRNGNGMLNDVKNLKEDTESINRNIISMNNKLENCCEESDKIIADIKFIKSSLNDKIGMSSISNLHKILIFIGALGGVISFIISLSSKIIQ